MNFRVKGTQRMALLAPLRLRLTDANHNYAGTRYALAEYRTRRCALTGWIGESSHALLQRKYVPVYIYI